MLTGIRRMLRIPEARCSRDRASVRGAAPDARRRTLAPAVGGQPLHERRVSAASSTTGTRSPRRATRPAPRPAAGAGPRARGGDAGDDQRHGRRAEPEQQVGVAGVDHGRRSRVRRRSGSARAPQQAHVHRHREVRAVGPTMRLERSADARQRRASSRRWSAKGGVHDALLEPAKSLNLPGATKRRALHLAPGCGGGGVARLLRGGAYPRARR